MAGRGHPARNLAGAGSRCVIKIIAEHGCSEEHHVRADLVQAAGFDGHGHERGAGTAGQDAVRGNRLLAAARDNHFFYMSGGDFLEPSLDNTLRRRRPAADQRQIFLAYLPLFELRAERVVSVGAQRHQQQPAGLFIQPMKQAPIAFDAQILEQFAITAEQTVEQ